MITPETILYMCIVSDHTMWHGDHPFMMFEQYIHCFYWYGVFFLSFFSFVCYFQYNIFVDSNVVALVKIWACSQLSFSTLSSAVDGFRAGEVYIVCE